MDLATFRRVLAELFEGRAAPRPLSLLEPALSYRAGLIGAPAAAAAAKTTVRRIVSLAASQDPMRDLLGDIPLDLHERELRVRNTLGQLLIGQLAEMVFTDLWLDALGDGDLRLRDDRASRTDTDFLVEDAARRQVFRLNIKFHGSRFRNARDLVGLDPEDTFALATYKIHGALLKQESEHLPYIFVVIGVHGLTGASVGGLIPDELVELGTICHASTRVSGKRSIEEAVVQRVVDHPDAYGIRSQLAGIQTDLRAAEWRVISARRADRLLRELLFERAFALRVRGFAQNYRGAELDMHFSVSTDLHPLQEMFDTLRNHGMPGLVSRLERGTL